MKFFYNDPVSRQDAMPHRGPHGFSFVLQNYFFRLLYVNLIFLVCCIPVVTLPAALCGMTAVLQKLLRSDHCNTLSDFWDEFKRDFWKRTAIGVVLLALPAAVWALLSLFSISGILATAIYLLLTLLLLGFWIPQMVISEATPLNCLGKSALMLMNSWKTSLVIVLCYGLFLLGWLLLWPYGTLFTFFFVFPQLKVCVAVNQLLDGDE